LPQIEVSFDIDANGILNVTAKDKATGKSQTIRIEGSSGLSEKEIEKMKKEAEAHAEEDRKKKDGIEQRNIADNLIYTTEKTLKEFGDKIEESLKKEITAKIGELKKAKESDNIEDIQRLSSELSSLTQKIGEQIYKQKPQGETGGSEETKENKEPEEGEFKEK